MFSMSRICTVLVVIAFSWVGVVGLACQSSPDAEPDEEPTADAPVAEEPTAEEPEAESPSPSADREPTQEDEEIAAQVSDQDLEVFASGVRALAKREAELEAEGRDYETRRAEATSPVEVREAERETLEEMKDAVQQEGIEFEAFMMMGQVIRQNPILMERLDEFLSEEEIDDFFIGE